MYLENNRVKKYPIRIALSWLAVVLWMAVIFAFSHQSADQSGALSGKLAATLVRLFDSQASDRVIEQYEILLRNLAHATVFLILALLVSWAFSELNITIWRNAFLTLLVSSLYAVLDELHQMFIPGRAGQLTDFLIDLGGIIGAIILFQLITAIRDLRQELLVQREEDLRL